MFVDMVKYKYQTHILPSVLALAHVLSNLLSEDS